jgi:hypothetical protein
MLAAGSFKSSKWGTDIWQPQHQWWYNAITSVSSTIGCWSSPTLAPDGNIYCLPTTNIVNTSVTLDGILMITPGSTSTDAPNSIFLPSGGANTPSIPLASANAGTQSRYIAKGVLAPNGKIYFCPGPGNTTNPNFLILTPNGVNSTWEIVLFSNIGLFTSDTFSGGVLGTDGHIYLIPTGSSSLRIKPRNTSINPSNNDIYEKGWWTGASGKNWITSNGGFLKPTDYNTSLQLSSTNPIIPQTASKASGYLRDAIVHPNGKIYVFPMNSQAQSRYIFILDPSKWNTIAEISTLPSLGLPTSGVNQGPLGNFSNVFLEKPKAGQELSTLKMYATYSGKWQTGNNTNAYYKTLVLDPTTNTWTLQGGQFDLAGNTASQPSFQLANGMITAVTGINPAIANIPNIGQVILTGNDVSENKLLDINKNIIYNDVEANLIRNKFGSYNGFTTSYGSGISITSGNAKGKTIFSGPNGGGFLTSVKGYHPNIKYFGYTTNYGTFTSSIYVNEGLDMEFINDGESSIAITGIDLTSSLILNAPFIISGTNDNDGVYTVGGTPTYSGGITTIPVVETVTNEIITADITYGQLVRFPTISTIQIWGVGNNMYSSQYTINDGPNVGSISRNLSDVPVVNNGYTTIVTSTSVTIVNAFSPTTTISFAYTNDDSEIYEIPSNLSNLTNSMWNRYFNKPC